MQKVVILFVVISLFSCKKESIETGYPLGGSSWTLYFKNNPTFTFYAESQLYFAADNKVINNRNADTLTGFWETKNNAVTIQFDNDDVYLGTIFTNDSIAGTLTASGNNGNWYAIRQ